MIIISVICLGFIIGLLARFIKPGDDDAGFIATTLLGISGSVLAYLFGRILDIYNPGEYAGFFMSLFGAILFLYIFQFAKRIINKFRVKEKRKGSRSK